MFNSWAIAQKISGLDNDYAYKFAQLNLLCNPPTPTSEPPTATPGASFSLPYASPTYPQQFGPVNLPRVYALNLDTLELASSGAEANTETRLR